MIRIVKFIYIENMEHRDRHCGRQPANVSSFAVPSNAAKFQLQQPARGRIVYVLMQRPVRQRDSRHSPLCECFQVKPAGLSRKVLCCGS